jgi:hypothetical protein
MNRRGCREPLVHPRRVRLWCTQGLAWTRAPRRRAARSSQSFSAGLRWVGVNGAPGEGEQADPPVVAPTPCTRLRSTGRFVLPWPAPWPRGLGATDRGAADAAPSRPRGGWGQRARPGWADGPGAWGGEVCRRAACSLLPLWFSYSSALDTSAAAVDRMSADKGQLVDVRTCEAALRTDRLERLASSVRCVGEDDEPRADIRPPQPSPEG